MVPVRAGMPFVPWRDPCEATRLLRYGLPRHGFLHTDQGGLTGSSATSVLTEHHVRCQDGPPIRHGGSAPAEAPAACEPARHVASPQLDQHPESSREGRSPTNSVRGCTA